ncbi:MAG: MarR family transcriptional regulator [Rhodobacteraceae bacterium]|nr:MarR family transcriptional regulator [Paracoccaceae bacterium]
MTLQPAPAPRAAAQLAAQDYRDLLSLLERLHRLLLDVIKDEFERLRLPEVTHVQALLIYNIGDHEVTAGELKSRGYYQGSNVSYNLKKLVEGGFMHHQRCEIDRRSVRVRLTPQGKQMRDRIEALFARHEGAVTERVALPGVDLGQVNHILRRLEQLWSEQIRFIY